MDIFLMVLPCYKKIENYSLCSNERINISDDLHYTQ